MRRAFVATTFSLLALVVALNAWAHVPMIEPEQRVVEEPERSWAFYDELPPGETHAWTFTLAEGDPLFVSVGIPPGSTWRPTARLSGPQGPIPLVAEDAIDLEPATPYAARSVWTLDARAPASGEYTLLIGGDGGPYSFGYGLTERFTPLEWARVPIDALRIHAWLGQPLWPTALLYALPVVGVATLATLGRIRAPLLPHLAAAFFLASALDRWLQLAIAAAAGAQAPAGAWLVSAAAAIPALALAWGAWSARRPLALALIGVAGVAFWAGLLVGPALAIAAALGIAAEARVPAAERRPGQKGPGGRRA